MKTLFSIRIIAQFIYFIDYLYYFLSLLSCDDEDFKK